MSEPTNEPTNEPTPQQNAEPQGEPTDWKAEARKWEARAKENKEAQEELQRLKEAQMSEQEKLAKRAEEAEKKLAEAESRIQRSKDVAEVAAESGVPSELLEFCADREAMEEFVKAYAKSQPDEPTVHAAPKAPKSRLSTNNAVKASTADIFAEMLEDF